MHRRSFFAVLAALLALFCVARVLPARASAFKVYSGVRVFVDGVELREEVTQASIRRTMAECVRERRDFLVDFSGA